MNTDPPSGPASSADRAEKTLEKGLEAAAAPFRVLYDAPVNILIVDDEPKNLLVLETLLDNPGYRLVRAQSADEALLALVNEEFALLILDIQMPVTNGIELAKLIKQRKKTALIPIIFLTAYYNDGVDVLEGYGSGAVDYLHKPVNAAILRSKVAVFAELHRKSRELAVANRALLAEVTQRRRAEEQLRELNDTLEQRVTQRTEALRESEHFLQRITDVTPGVIYVFDFEQQCNVFVNRSFASILGYSDEEIKAMGADVTRALIHPEDLPRFGVHQARICALGDQEFADFEYRMRDRSGQWLWFHSRDVVFARSPAGGARQLIGMAMDVTTRKRAESELTEAVAAAEKANSAKSDFLSGMSHELRTPLNAILGFAQLLESEAPVPTPGQQRNVDQILKAGWYLLTLINEILDLAGIESGKVSISHEPVLLEAIFLECQAMIEPQAKKRGIEITFPRFATPCVVNADYTRLKQVMFNLLTNAIKYSREGGAVVVQCETRSENITRISVSDTGAGLPRERLAQLFQPFNRLGQETGRVEGTGIGLVVAKKLVELMGGVIGVDSAVGAGSTFWLELIASSTPHLEAGGNCALDPGEQVQVTTHDVSSPRTIVYVEDNPANLEFIERLIAHRSDLRLLAAPDGNLGIEFARTYQPDLILMDISLPGISGIDAMKILRADPLTAHIPIIALSANAVPRDIEKGLEAGFFNYITKPIKVKQFMDALDVALTSAQGAPGRTAPKTSGN